MFSAGRAWHPPRCGCPCHVLCAATAQALINPHFTPVHLVKQAGLIVSVDLKQGASKDQYVATIREVLKGKTELKSLRLDLSKAINTQNADALRELAAAGKPALFFVGEFAEDRRQGGGAGRGAAACCTSRANGRNSTAARRASGPSARSTPRARASGPAAPTCSAGRWTTSSKTTTPKCR